MTRPTPARPTPAPATDHSPAAPSSPPTPRAISSPSKPKSASTSPNSPTSPNAPPRTKATAPTTDPSCSASPATDHLCFQISGVNITASLNGKPVQLDHFFLDHKHGAVELGATFTTTE